MKENIYDNEHFFEKYGQMTRSKDGLLSAGEWYELKKLLPDFTSKRLLDVGCGYGWHCIYAMEQGAASAVGVDISSKMLDVAKEKTTFKNVEYRCVAMEDMDFEPNSFDVALSSLAFHYVEDFDLIVKKIHSYLKHGGSFVFSVEHPLFTAYGTQDWFYNVKGEIMFFPVDNYYYEGKRVSKFLGESVVKFHKTLTTYLNTLLLNDFEILSIVEPCPSAEMLATIPSMKDEMRRPMMLLVSAVKK